MLMRLWMTFEFDHYSRSCSESEIIGVLKPCFGLDLVDPRTSLASLFPFPYNILIFTFYILIHTACVLVSDGWWELLGFCWPSANVSCPLVTDIGQSEASIGLYWPIRGKCWGPSLTRILSRSQVRCKYQRWNIIFSLRSPFSNGVYSHRIQIEIVMWWGILSHECDVFVWSRYRLMTAH